MNNKTNSIIFLIVGLILGGLIMHFCSNYTITKKNADTVDYTTTTSANTSATPEINHDRTAQSNSNSGSNIEELTNETKVIAFVKQNHQLPDFYITKSEARKQGWNPSQGNLCDVLPGKAIGGDYFSNREKSLPAGNHYFEADVNYNCGNRGADRIVFTKNGDVWLTKNHYKTFEKQ